MSVELKTPTAELTYEFDWSGEETEGVILLSVEHHAPYPVLVLAETLDAPNWRSYVRIGGGLHSKEYVITAVATLSSGDKVPGAFTLRVMADASIDTSTATTQQQQTQTTTENI